MARDKKEDEKIVVNLTPMIDIVFQLLIFFVMSFKIIVPEGDFSFKIPMALTCGHWEPSPIKPIFVTLKSDPHGQLSQVRCGQKSGQNLGSGEEGLKVLQRLILLQVAPQGGRPNPKDVSDMEVNLTCDFRLKYEHVIRCLNYVTGYKEGNEIVRIAKTINFGVPIE